jgi:hypothetical protein
VIPKEERDGWLKAINGMEEKYRAANAITEEECAEFAFSRCLLKHADEADKVIERLTMALTKQRDACRDYQTMANPAWTCTRCTIPCDMQAALAAGQGREKA